MVKKLEFEDSIGSYKLPMVAIFDDTKISDQEAIKLVESGREEAGDYFAVISLNTYRLLKKAVDEAIQRNASSSL